MLDSTTPCALYLSIVSPIRDAASSGDFLMVERHVRGTFPASSMSSASPQSRAFANLRIICSEGCTRPDSIRDKYE
jgi:hypothetical protein